MNYIFHIIIMICYYSFLTIGLNLIIGFGNIWFLGIPLCSGIGAYVAILMITKLGFPVITGLFFAGITGFIVGTVFALVYFRIRGDYFLIISLGACEITVQTINELSGLTGGAIGIIGIPPLGIGDFQLIKPYGIMIIFLIFLFLVINLWRIFKNSILRVLVIGSGNDQELMRSLGIQPTKYLMLIFLVAGIIAGISGWLFAHYQSYLDASILSVQEAIMIFCMVILGGLHSHYSGCIVGAAIFYTLPLLFQKIGFSDSVAFQLRPILFGFVLILYMFIKYSSLFLKFKGIKISYGRIVGTK